MAFRRAECPSEEHRRVALAIERETPTRRAVVGAVQRHPGVCLTPRVSEDVDGHFEPDRIGVDRVRELRLDSQLRRRSVKSGQNGGRTHHPLDVKIRSGTHRSHVRLMHAANRGS